MSYTSQLSWDYGEEQEWYNSGFADEYSRTDTPPQGPHFQHWCWGCNKFATGVLTNWRQLR
ncbi:hypothetical protein E4U41_000492 [Claviceps citrina]|nr:hypothetical protein E4U41_000492 [Claviceps citrina]